MAKNRPNINGNDVIGFDEINNGFHLSRICDLNLPLVIPAYLYRNYPGAQHANEKYEKKGGVFTPQGGRKDAEVISRAVGYLNLHPDFYYSRITEKEAESRPLICLRAEAVAAMTLRFFRDYNLSENTTFVCLDHLGNDSSSEDLENCIRDLFKEARIFQNKNECHVYFQHKADKFNRACKTADRAGYHLLALKFRAGKKRWPCRDRIVDKSKFLEYLIERATGLRINEHISESKEFLEFEDTSAKH
jgi:hypothetical protein